jgi:hypothetical protein
MDFIVDFGTLKSFGIEYNRVLLSVLYTLLGKYTYNS